MNSKQLRRFATVAGWTLVLAAGRAMAAAPADGGFYTNWGLFGSGKNIVSFDLGGALTDTAAGAVVGPDGSMYIAGTVIGGDGRNHFGVSKFNPGGVLDSSFSGDGRAVSLEADVTATSIAMTADGHLLVAGYKVVSGTDYDFIVCQFSASSGANLNFPQPTNAACVKAIFFPGTQDIARDIAIQPDGKFVLAGSTGINSPTDRYAAFARFEANGQPDLGFGNLQGSNVSVIRNNNVFTDHNVQAVGVASNGKIVGIGSTTVTGGTEVGALMIRLNADGTQDDIGPQKEYTFSRDNSANRDTVLQSMVLVDSPDSTEDDVVASGYVQLSAGIGSGFIAKIRSNGVLDGDFGTQSGFTSVTAASGSLDFTKVARQPDGSFVTIGVRAASDALDLSVRRFMRTGQVDNAFGSNGEVTIDMGTAGQLDIAADVVAKNDAIYVAGYSYISVSNYDFVAAKLGLDRIFTDGVDLP